jgi:predicted PurR-regulated permease PerM
MDERFFERVIGLAALAFLVLLFLQILAPFVAPLLWATTLTVTAWPLFVRLRARLGGRSGLAAFLMTLFLFLILVVPIGALVHSLTEQVTAVTRVANDLVTMGVPAPPAWLLDLPLIGGPLDDQWRATMIDSRATLREVQPYIGTAAAWILARGADIGFAILQFVLAVILAGILFVHGETSADYMRRFARRIGSERTVALVDLAGKTIRGVALGVGGTALVQAMIAAVIFVVAGVPGAGLLALLTFMVGLLQLPVVIVPLPVAIWLGYQGLTGWAIFVAAGGVFISTIDNFIRPMLIRQGAKMPILLVFLGVLGGLVAYGPIGMFFGAMVVAVAHRLLTEWLREGSGEHG